MDKDDKAENTKGNQCSPVTPSLENHPEVSSSGRSRVHITNHQQSKDEQLLEGNS